MISGSSIATRIPKKIKKNKRIYKERIDKVNKIHEGRSLKETYKLERRQYA